MINSQTLILMYGSSGFIGNYVTRYLNNHNIFYISSKTRTYNFESIENDILKYKPTHIISLAGSKIESNIDCFEINENKKDLILTNTIGNYNLAYLSDKHNIHLTLFMSGCIYNYRNNYDKQLYKNEIIESYPPNFKESYYSYNRIYTEEILKPFTNICILRLRMPISNSLHPKSLITKVINYKTIHIIPNSMTVLDDLIPFVGHVIKNNLIGTYNLVNPGITNHRYILNLYKKFVNPNYKFKIIHDSEQKIIAPRSNCHLSSNKVQKYLRVSNINHSIIRIMKSYKRIVDKYHLF